ncbi:MAG: VIT and VWA domain-containing protein [bacterium]|nr:VIT and VWA domain-containing protein [bacterium]
MFSLLRFDVALGALLAAAMPLLAADPPSRPPTTPTPGGLLIADGGLGGVLEILSHDVRVTINNGIAVTSIDQVFHNTEGRTVEALYTFPVPKNASVANFSMWIAGKEMVGEVVEKRRAREIYDSYKRVNRDPGLLEQVDYSTFEMRIFPIAADAEQRVRIEYYQELDVDNDWCTYTYPLATTTRPGLDSSVKGRFSLTLEAKSPVPMRAMKSTSHPDEFVVATHADTYHEASMELSGGDLSRDVVLAWRLERARTGLDFLASRQDGEDGFLQMTLTAGKELENRDVGMDYVFVSDVSGSMANAGKLGLSQNQVRAFIDALGPEDRFELVSFSVQSATLFGGLAAVNDESRTMAAEFLGSQRARGGTRLRPALEAAFRYLDADRPLNVVILSDGMTEQNENRELLRLIRGRPAGARMFCIGVGNEINRPLLRQVAESTGGLAAFLSRGDDFERRAAAFRRKLTRPAIADVTVTIDGVAVHDMEPAVLPSLFHGSPLRMYARYRGHGKATVKLTGTIEGAPFAEVYDIDLPRAQASNPEIERMWAWHRVQALMDREREEGDTGRHVPEIVRLCEGFSIPGEHASFLVLENDQEYRRWKIERKNATRLARDRQARSALREQLDRLRSDAEKLVGPQPELAPEREPLADARSNRPAPSRNRKQSPPTQRPSPRRSNHGDSGGRSGAGAFDPLTGSLLLGGLALAGVARRRRARQPETRSS